MSGQNTVTACLKQSFRQLLKKGWTWGSRRVKKMPTHTLGTDVVTDPGWPGSGLHVAAELHVVVWTCTPAAWEAEAVSSRPAWGIR